MDINQLKFLDIIVNTKSFNKAAEKCFVSTSTLTRRVTAMEAEIGFTIFMRGASGVTLTPQGELFYRQTQEIPRLYENAVSNARSLGHKKQLIRVSIFSYMRKYIIRPCETYKAKHPNVDFSFVSCRFGDNSQAILNYQADLALLAEMQDTGKGLFFLPVFRSPNSVIVSSMHPFAHRENIRMEELDGQTILLSAKAASSRNFQAIKNQLAKSCPHSSFREYQHPDQADAFCQIDGNPILSLHFLESNPGFRQIPLSDAPSVIIGAICREEDVPLFIPFMEHFRNDYKERGIESSLDIL